LSETESLINSHFHAPACATGYEALPGLCNCGRDNSCSRLTTGNPTRAAMFDTMYTFSCTIITIGYVVMQLTLFAVV